MVIPTPPPTQAPPGAPFGVPTAARRSQRYTRGDTRADTRAGGACADACADVAADAAADTAADTSAVDRPVATAINAAYAGFQLFRHALAPTDAACSPQRPGRCVATTRQQRDSPVRANPGGRAVGAADPDRGGRAHRRRARTVLPKPAHALSARCVRRGAAGPRSRTRASVLAGRDLVRAESKFIIPAFMATQRRRCSAASACGLGHLIINCPVLILEYTPIRESLLKYIVYIEHK